MGSEVEKGRECDMYVKTSDFGGGGPMIGVSGVLIEHGTYSFCVYGNACDPAIGHRIIRQTVYAYSRI